MDARRASELLEAERERIVRALVGRRPTQSEDLSLTDAADLGSDVLIAELDEGLSDDLREELAAVDRAEARLAAGTYGLSVESGEVIPDERLEALPTAERTAEEQAVFEGRVEQEPGESGSPS
jgi:DnaK suppressor protein